MAGRAVALAFGLLVNSSLSLNAEISLDLNLDGPEKNSALLDLLLPETVRTRASVYPQIAPNPNLGRKAEEALARGSDALQIGHFSIARSAAQEVTETRPREPEGWHLLGLVLAAQDRTNEAIAALDRAADLYTANADPLIVKGDLLRETGRPAAARVAYEAARARDPENWRAGEGLAALALADGQPDDAIAVLQASVARVSPEAFLPRLSLAMLQSEFGRVDAAIALFEAYVETVPKRLEGWSVLGQLRFTAHDFAGAADAFARADALTDGNVELRLALAQASARADRKEAAEVALLSVLELDPTSSSALLGLGRLAELEGRTEAAADYYEAAVASAPDAGLGPRLALAGVYLAANRASEARALLTAWEKASGERSDAASSLLARAIWMEGDLDAARALFDAYLARAETPTSFFATSDFMVSQGDLDEAEAILLRAREAFPDSADALSALGRLYGARQLYDAALDAYQRALALDPGARVPLKGASLAEYRLGRLEAALEYAVALSTRDDASAEDFVWVAMVENATARSDAAISAYETALEHDPENWLAMNNLAALLYERDPARSVELAKAAAARAGDVPAVRDTLGWAQFSTGNLSEAHAIYADLVAKHPDSPMITYRLGRVLLEQGNKEAGLDLMRRALTLDPEFADAAQARSLLSEN